MNRLSNTPPDENPDARGRDTVQDPQQLLGETGGEAVDGSGFETEMPEPDFDERS